MKLKGKVAIVTGAGVGIGAVYSRRLAEEGASVVCADLNGDGAREVADGIRSGGGRSLAVQLDVSSKEATDSMVRSATEEYGRVDILLNNAAMFTALPEGPFEELTEENWDRCMQVNLKGLWNTIRSAAPGMKERRYGKIVNVSSATWMMGRPNRLDYVTSKAGVVGLTRAVASELGPYGINVNAIVPGLIQNESTQKVYESAYFERTVERQALKRGLRSEDLCGAVVFLASDDAEMITGQALVVDGGIVFH